MMLGRTFCSLESVSLRKIDISDKEGYYLNCGSQLSPVWSQWRERVCFRTVPSSGNRGPRSGLLVPAAPRLGALTSRPGAFCSLLHTETVLTFRVNNCFPSGLTTHFTYHEQLVLQSTSWAAETWETLLKASDHTNSLRQRPMKWIKMPDS